MTGKHAKSCSGSATLPLQACAQQYHLAVTANLEAEDRLMLEHMIGAISLGDQGEGVSRVLDN